MSNHVSELAERFRQACGELGYSAGCDMQLLKQRLFQQLHVSRNTNPQYDENLTTGQRLTDQIAAVLPYLPSKRNGI